MDFLRFVPGVFRLLGILLVVTVVYQPCCQGFISGRMAVSSTNKIRKIGTNVRPTTRKSLLIRNVKRPTEATVIHRTMIVPSSRITFCPKSRCPASIPKACRVMSISYRAGRRCHQCVVKRSCRVSKPTKTNIPRKLKTISNKPSQKIIPRKLKTMSNKATQTMIPRKLKPMSKQHSQKIIRKNLNKISNKQTQKMLPRKLKTLSRKPTQKKMISRKLKASPKSSRTPAKSSRIMSARMNNAIRRSRTRAKVNNFEGRWMKGFSSD